MPSAGEIQALHEKRAAGVKAASERRDVDDLMSWHSKDATFVNCGMRVSLRYVHAHVGHHAANDITIAGRDSIRAFYTQAYAAMPSFKVRILKLTGFTPEFVACEMECEGKASSDMPGFDLKAGDSLRLRGVSLFWWRWEGEGEDWDGTMSEAAIRGWKIIEEHAYHQRV